MNLDSILEKLSQAKEITFDFETRSDSTQIPKPNLHHKTLIPEGIAFVADTLDPIFIWLENVDKHYGLTKLEMLEFMQKALGFDAIYIGHNLQFDLKVAKYFYGVCPTNIFDTLVAGWYLNENRRNGLKELGPKLLGVEMKSYGEHLKEAKEKIWNEAIVEAERVLNEAGLKITKKAIKELATEITNEAIEDREWIEEYGALDAIVTYDLYKMFKEELAKNSTISTLFYDLEMPFVHVLMNMTLSGIHVNVPFLKEMEDYFSNKQIELEQVIYKELGEFDIQSPNQLAEKLYGIRVTRKGGVTKLEDARVPGVKYATPKVFSEKTNAPSTSEEALKDLKTDAAELIRNYREVMKLLNTYVIGYQKYCFDGVLYPNFNHVGAKTGRLSSSEPNMQNLSASPTDGYFIRDAFIAPEGYVLIVADESQLELRLLAHYSDDDYLVNAFISGADIHSKTASDVLAIPIEDVTSTQRRHFKTINFAIMYGMGAPALADNLGITQKEAQELLDAYFSRYSGVRDFITKTEHRITKRGYVTTILGRHRRIPTIWSSNKKLVSKAKRQAVNSIIQGSASDILKAAMIKIDDEFTERGLDANILLQVHDELVCRASIGDSEEASAIIKKHMENPFNIPLKVPLIAEPTICQKWSDGKD